VTEAAAVLGTLGVVAAIAGRSRVVVLAGLAGIAVAELLLARGLLPQDLGSSLGSAAGVGALAVGLPAVGALAALFVRFAAVVPVAVVAAAPFRFPFELGTEHRFLIALGEDGALGRLIPVYVVIAAAGAALAWTLARGEPPRALPPLLAIPAALLLGLTTLSLLWAYDPAAAEDRVTFFVLPFAALLAIVARAPMRPWLPRALAVAAVALASLFAAFGLVEAWARELVFYDPKVAVANEYTSYFRVTSVFSDPSIYARHLAIVIAALVALLWLGRVGLVLGGGLVAFLWAGLYFSYSQSSMVALATAVVAVSYLAAEARTRRWLVGAAIALVVVGAIAFVALLQTDSAERVTSGRSELVSDTLVVVGNHPLAGVGVASQPAASRDEAGGARRVRRNVSHTAPLTVAAELGALGIALYVAFLAGATSTLLQLRRRAEPLGLALLGLLVVVFVHSLVYGVFFEDPLLWAGLGIAAAALAARELAEPSPARDRPRPSSEPAAAAP
jgi:putative inorganic carbon (hco3(-)) transporter